uniref:Nucleotide-diphospho-sugar transferase n=1 Tax=Chlorobium phaeovibrioides (strain DSM 265 / 1930) TaxID=290318 RepID=A4SDT9_CHLPM
MKSAVLFLVFNRPDTTKQVFEAIRKAQPPRLYVAADGPRADRQGEREKCEEVRRIATAVDWECEVKTLFREKNLGCKTGVSSGIDWFFEHEEEGIILEDDCLPHPDFFKYCQWCLSEFKSNTNVWHINGNNFAANRGLYNANTIDFVGLAQVWGWASWANRWKAAEKNVFYLSERVDQYINVWQVSSLARMIKQEHLKALQYGLDAWDYQWQISILNAGGFVVSPSSNLISNLGDGADATHTQFDNERTHLPVSSLKSFVYGSVSLNKSLTGWYERKMGLNGYVRVLKIIVKNAKRVPRKLFKRMVQKILFQGVGPIVIASSGRSGSTMLTSAVAESLVVSRFSYLPALFRNHINRFSIEYLARISELNKESAPVLKTHDLFRKESKDKARFVFVFGDPLESAQSVEQQAKKHGSVWVEEHIYHLVGQGSSVEILEKDALNYESQLMSWGFAEGAFLVHYDDLWQRNAELSRFIGFDVQLPERRPRSSKPLPTVFNKALFDHLKKLEIELKRKIA